MECKRCGNKDPAYFYKGHKGYYCRACIGFARLILDEEPEQFDYAITQGADEYHFDYSLTGVQKEASKKCALYAQRCDVLLECVCGAGKTEIAVETISDHLKKGLKVAYAIARREVVIELSKRFSQIFPKARVAAVYGGHHEQLDGDLIVCTCHQLYRYYRTFDLLVLDEVDAFPLKGNRTLLNISLNSCKGHVVFSTATVDDDLRQVLDRRVYKKVEVFTRPSGKPLSIPQRIYLPRILAYVKLFFLKRKITRRCIVFVGRKKEAYLLQRIFSRFYSCTYVYSDLEQRNENIASFRNGEYDVMFATSVLERGITLKDIDVVILDYDDHFDRSSIIQMLGRVGRGLDSEGDSYLFCLHPGKKIEGVIRYLRKANSYL